jgi:FAD/FMN-containing dehydrogenase
MTMLTRKEFLALTGLAALSPRRLVAQSPRPLLVNDVHSKLNETRVDRVETPASADELRKLLRTVRAEGRHLSIAGGRHAMGAQQFLTGGVLLDTRRLNRVLGFDVERGLVEVEAGIEWPELVDYLLRVQDGQWPQWGIAQKQTGGDRLTLGGTLSANAHGRGLTMKPFIGDVESFTLIDADGNTRACSRTENAELFALAIGGYGLFGVIYSVRLRLARRLKLERVVEVIDVGQVMAAFERRIAAGFLYGDFQYSIDEDSPEYLRKGVFSCYRPVAPETPMPSVQRELSDANWRELLHLAHVDEQAAFDRYASYYLSTSGQLYWSDTHQMSIYPVDYHDALDRRSNAAQRATEMITEIYVRRADLAAFMADAAEDCRRHGVQNIYGTVRLIERDDESFLAWAKDAYACIIFNLHIEHTADGVARAADAFRRLINLGIKHGGRYYLTYHKHATREQVEACYPEFPEFLRLKRRYDPQELFQSDWYLHYREMFGRRA